MPPASIPRQLGAALPPLDSSGYDYALAGSPKRWGDYADGEKIDHVDGQTIEEAEHQLATRLFQNTARVHFNQHVEGKGRFGRRLVYGGHIISIARALSFNGLANAFHILGLNGARHVAPSFAGDTIYAWSEVLDKAELRGRSDMGALRLRTFAVKDRACADFPGLKADGSPRGRRRPRHGLLGRAASLESASSTIPKALGATWGLKIETSRTIKGEEAACVAMTRRPQVIASVDPSRAVAPCAACLGGGHGLRRAEGRRRH